MDARRDRDFINAIFQGELDHGRPWQGKIFAGDFAFNDRIPADLAQIDPVGFSGGITIIPEIFQLLIEQILVGR